MKYKFILFASFFLTVYLLFNLTKEDTSIQYSWLTENHINEAAKVLEPVLPKLEDYVLNGNKRLPKKLSDINMEHYENIDNNNYVAGLAIQFYSLAVTLKDAESGKRTNFLLEPQLTTAGVRWNCNIGQINPQFFENAFPGCIAPWSTPNGRLMEMVGAGIPVEVKKLLARGADINHISGGYTPLFLAIRSKSPGMVKLLIKEGADVNLVADKDYGKTPLMYAIEKNNIKIIKALVENGADLNAKDNDGESVLDYVEKGDYELEDYLVENGARVKI